MSLKILFREGNHDIFNVDWKSKIKEADTPPSNGNQPPNQENIPNLRIDGTRHVLKISSRCIYLATH